MSINNSTNNQVIDALIAKLRADGFECSISDATRFYDERDNFGHSERKLTISWIK